MKNKICYFLITSKNSLSLGNPSRSIALFFPVCKLLATEYEHVFFFKFQRVCFVQNHLCLLREIVTFGKQHSVKEDSTDGNSDKL